MNTLKCFGIMLLLAAFCNAEPVVRKTISLNGSWDFEQSKTAFPPQKFTRKIPVPGLIHLARPKIEQYDLYFPKPGTVAYERRQRGINSFIEPLYNWYRIRFKVNPDLSKKYGVLTLHKSQFVTQAFLNGIELGTSMACYTPIDFVAGHAIRHNAENELLVRIGPRDWLPPAAAGSSDTEKLNYLPGIWDDVALSFTGPLRIHRALILPDLAGEKIVVKLLVQNFNSAQILYGDKMQDSCRVRVTIHEKNSQKVAAEGVFSATARRDNRTEMAFELTMPSPHPWSADDPFLYVADITLMNGSDPSDEIQKSFGMRDFQRRGKQFALNGEKIILRGTNITLHRFFEDPECEALPWDRAWVTRLLNDLPKQLHWNAMRVCVGIAPSLWYDIADESGLLLQNEWMYWQNHGWDDQIRAEYTDWVWSDGHHPSIAIWDAINENRDAYIGNQLIPELKKLDPTRVWDAGYMTSEHMQLDEMDEPHPYQAPGHGQTLEQYRLAMDRNPYPLGDLDAPWPGNSRDIGAKSAAQLVNEYGWIWLWRDGTPARLTPKQYDYYLDGQINPTACRELQAYWLQLETEWLRAERSLAGVLAFCYLSNNYSYTGDWFVGAIKDLTPGPTLNWFQHCFAPTAVFLDLCDERYTKHTSPHQPGSDLLLNLVGVSDEKAPQQGQVLIKIVNSAGKVDPLGTFPIKIPGFGKKVIPAQIRLPEEAGGYLLLAEFHNDDLLNAKPVLSRRYIKIGNAPSYLFFNITPEPIR